MGNRDYELEYDVSTCAELIFNWYQNKNSNTLNIISAPFNTNMIFNKVLLAGIDRGEKILYLWGDISKNYTIERVCNNKEINFCYYNEYINVNRKYDLVIIDDISTFSKISTDKLKRAIKYIKNFSNKIIIYSVEEVLNEGEVIEYLSIDGKKPFVEPRLINTRIDLNKDIPYMLYDYIKWFIKNKKKTIIYVPDEEKLNAVYEYYTKKLKIKRITIVPLVKNEDKKLLRQVLVKSEMSTIIITNNLEADLIGSNIGNAVVLFADENVYTYKKLLFICSELGAINSELPEVLLVDKDLNGDVEKLKSITRHYNEIRWKLSSKK